MGGPANGSARGDQFQPEKEIEVIEQGRAKRLRRGGYVISYFASHQGSGYAFIQGQTVHKQRRCPEGQMEETAKKQ